MIQLETTAFGKFGGAYLDRLKSVLDSSDIDSIGKLISLCEEARLRHSTVYFIGNGGSAATASHFASDFLGANIKCSISPPYRAVSLCDNNAVLTAFGNDFGYEEVFVNQLKVLFRPNDVVVAISASGNSPNVVKAVEWANQNGGNTFALLGFDGGRLLEIAQSSFLCKTEKGEYGPVEDMHMIVDHMINLFVLQGHAK